MNATAEKIVWIVDVLMPENVEEGTSRYEKRFEFEQLGTDDEAQTAAQAAATDCANRAVAAGLLVRPPRRVRA
jgi:hypothetical protein